MLKFSRTHFAALYRQKKFIIVVCSLCVVALLILQSYKSGPAKNGQAVTGAPFNSSLTCSKCHGGGSYGGSIKTQLLDSTNKAVGKYMPGKKYTFRIMFSKTSTTTTLYGFQTTAATLTNVNINKWNTLPANTHNTLLSSHNYIEQSTALTTSIIRIPWTGPKKGTGSIKFYTAGNLVNNNGGTTGDQPVSAILTVTESAPVAAITLNNLNGNIQNNIANITWSTPNENEVHSYIIEKSTNNTNFQEIGTVMSKGGGDYKFTDPAFNSKAYYRVRITDVNGNTSFSDAVTLASPDKNNYKLGLYNHAGYSYILFSNGGRAQKVQVVYTDIQGRPLSSGITFANEGDNTWDIPRTKIKGIVIVNVITEDGIRTSLKFATTP
ncbi:choice-of-anchor V domain-containing protein [Panacibacter ginsenosidivorans]|nr:choice-of-anchor V domain-containing protein [Panacibacter ginsenosidivorans]